MKKPTQEQLNTAREVIEWFQEECERGAPSPAIEVFQAALDNLPVEMTERELKQLHSFFKVGDE